MQPFCSVSFNGGNVSVKGTGIKRINTILWIFTCVFNKSGQSYNPKNHGSDKSHHKNPIHSAHYRSSSLFCSNACCTKKWGAVQQTRTPRLNYMKKQNAY